MKNQKHVLGWIVSILVVALITLWPLFKPGFYISDDGEWMIIRLTAFYQSLAEGQFPVRFLGRLNYSYGYPVANFLYPGFLYIGSLLHFIGFSFVDSVKLILGLSTAGSAFFLFLWLKRHFSGIASFAGTVSFLFSPYLVYDMYKRGSVGEVLATTPLFAALYSIDAKKRWLFPLGIALLIISHNSLALLFLFFIALYLVKQKRQEFIFPFLLGIGLASFFWMPALYERKFVQFDSVIISKPFEYFITGNLFWLIGPAFVLASFFLLTGKEKKPVNGVFMLICFFTSVWFASVFSLPLWSLPQFSRLFQFPYRMLAVGLITGPWIVASTIEVFTKKRVLLLFLFGIIGIGSIAWSNSHISFVNRPEGYYTTNEATTTVANEYMPRWVHDLPEARVSKRIEVNKGNATIVTNTITTQKLDVSIDAKEESVVQINTIYYPGWGITIDSQPVVIDYQNQQGVMRVTVPIGKHRLQGEFRETVSRFLVDLLSLISFVLYSIYVVRKILKE